MATTTVKVLGSVFSWEQMEPLWRGDDGSITFEDTGEPLVRRMTGKQAVGRRGYDAVQGQVVTVPDEDAERGLASGQVELVDDEPAKSTAKRAARKSAN
jgi:hypothetical protein